MDLLTYSTVLLLSAMGPIGGMLVGYYSREELIIEIRYIRIGEALVLGTIFGMVLFTRMHEPSMIAALVSAALIAIAQYRITQDMIWWGVGGILFGISSVTPEFTSIASLIFIYGILYGSRQYQSWKKIGATCVLYLTAGMIIPILAGSLTI